MKNICRYDQCKKNVFDGGDKCILHCEKGRRSEDKHKGVLSSFYDALVEYIVNSLLEERLPEEYNLVSFRTLLIKGEGSNNVTDFCATKKPEFTDIFFPDYDERDPKNYLNLLKKLKGAWFIRCTFTAGSINAPNLEVFFDECEFLRSWSITPLKVLNNANNVLFQNCKFLKGVSLFNGDPPLSG